MGNSASRFVVPQIDWARTDPDDGYSRRTVRVARVADFASFDAAEADRQRREAEERARVNPFRYGGAALFSGARPTIWSRG